MKEDLKRDLDALFQEQRKRAERKLEFIERHFNAARRRLRRQQRGEALSGGVEATEGRGHAPGPRRPPLE